jgi:hypothetical protein
MRGGEEEEEARRRLMLTRPLFNNLRTHAHTHARTHTRSYVNYCFLQQCLDRASPPTPSDSASPDLAEAWNARLRGAADTPPGAPPVGIPPAGRAFRYRRWQVACVTLSVCLSVCVPVCLSVFIYLLSDSFCLCLSLSICLPACLPACLYSST